MAPAPVPGRFADRVAFVTGAASGIGKAVARRLAAEGAAVVVADIDEAGASATATGIRGDGGRAESVGVDVADPASVERAVAVAKSAFGGLDLAVNNAGVGAEAEPIARLSIEGWQRVIGVNLSGVFYCLRSEIPLLLERGGGTIVNISSVMGVVAAPTAAAYVASKHGVAGLTKAAALEYGPENIRVNAIGPGFMVAPVRGQLPRTDTVVDGLRSLHALGRLGEHADIAAAVSFLLSDEAAFITGTLQLVDGGYTAR
jgi:NAD(P)-dependent dehydrogenase (short-subunit alcohol dehydrogenase family)